MPETVGEAFVAIRPDMAGFSTDLNAGVKGVVEGLAAGFAAVKVRDFFADANAQARDAQKTGAQTEAVLKSTAGAANIQADAVKALAEQLSEKVGVDHLVIESGENMLLTFRNIKNEAGTGNDIFTQATKATVDLAAGMAAASGGQLDLKSSAIQLGKALNDPIQGITALHRVGVTFTQGQKDQIKAMVENGNLLGAQKIILKEVMTEFGGSAAAQATDADKAKVAILDLKEAIGTALLPILDKGAQVVTALADGFSSLPEPAQQVATYLTLAGTAAVILAKGLSLIAETKGGLSSAFTAIKGALTGGGEGGFLGGQAAMASAGLWAAAAGLIVGTVAGLSRTISGENYKISLSMKDLASTTDAQLSKALGTVAKFDLGLVKQSFSKLLETDPASAPRFIAALDAAGVKTGWFKDQLDKASGGAGQHKKALDAAAAAVDGMAGSTAGGTAAFEKWAAAVDDTNKALTAIQNSLLGLPGAQLNETQAVRDQAKAQQDYNDAVAQYGPDSDQAKDAALRLDGANQGLASSTLALQAAQSAFNDIQSQTPAHIQAEIDKLKDAAAASPEAAAALQPYIDQLEAIKVRADALNTAVTLGITVTGADDAIAKLNAVNGQIFSIINSGYATMAAPIGIGAHGLVGLAHGGAGMIVGPHQPVLIGEGLSREAVVPFDNFGDMVSTIRNTGMADAFANAAVEAGGGLARAGGNRYTFNVTTSAPLGNVGQFMREMVREARTEMHLAGL